MKTDVNFADILQSELTNVLMCFNSLNPEIDIGQVEGGFMMGLGCHLLEDSKFDPRTGVLLTDGTWVRVKQFFLKLHLENWKLYLKILKANS